MLTWCDADRPCFWKLQGEHVLGVVEHAGGISMAPLGKNLVAVGELPIQKILMRDLDSCFLGHFTDCRIHQRLTRFLAAGNRLPVASVRGAFKQQHQQVGRVDHDQNRYRPFVDDHP